MESTPKLSTPEEELAYLREQVTRKETELAEKGKAPNLLERTRIISERIKEHHAAPEDILVQNYRINEATKRGEADAILTELNLGGGAGAIDGLRRTMEEKGINVVEVKKRMETFVGLEINERLKGTKWETLH